MSNRGRHLSAIAVACLLTGAACAPAMATDLNELAAASRFVVHSRVSNVQYTQSEAGTQGQPGIPHTIVTFDVVRSLQGSAGAASFTLRFVGGPDGRGRFMRASNVPVFQAGDEDILFVRDSGANGCALAGCVDGRFRVLNGMVYDGTGAPVQRIESNRVVAGGQVPAELATIRFPRPSFDNLMKNAEAREALGRHGLSMAEARQRYETQAPAVIEMSMISGGASAADRSGQGQGHEIAAGSAATARTLSADDFVAQLSRLTVARADSTRPFQSADAESRIAAPSSQATAPANVRTERVAPARTAADIAEERALPKDDLSLTRNKPQ